MFFFFFFNDTATTEIYTLSLHDALPICGLNAGGGLLFLIELNHARRGVFRFFMRLLVFGLSFLTRGNQPKTGRANREPEDEDEDIFHCSASPLMFTAFMAADGICNAASSCA